MNGSKILERVIEIVLLLAFASAGYVIIVPAISNITGSGAANTGLLVLITTLYWLIIGFAAIKMLMSVVKSGKSY